MGAPVVGVGVATEDWAGDALVHEYTAAADPLKAGTITRVPIARFASGTGTGVTGFHAFDVSAALGVEFPATSPALLGGFVRANAGERVTLGALATSRLVYGLEGAGAVDGIAFDRGDLVAVPGATTAVDASAPLKAYVVDDSPLLRYLGVTAVEPRFEPTRYPAAFLDAELARVAADPHAPDRNRISILLGNRSFGQTMTVTHSMWAMYGLLPRDAVQRPHRHQSVAVDLAIDCRPGCYTLIGSRVSAGRIVDPVRVDWEPGAVFVTPPGLWHSHHNESGADARLMPVQDAGLHTHLRTLDIRFSG